MKTKVNFILSLLLGLLLINAGLNKFFNYLPVPENLSQELLDTWRAFETIGWLMPLVGIAEVIGGVLFIIPRTRVIGALIVLPVIVGILLSNFSISPEGLPMATLLFAINLWIIIDNKQKFQQLLQTAS
jgi:uncharacterized membrane protein YphA (DoxX/SURF4 family)